MLIRVQSIQLKLFLTLCLVSNSSKAKLIACKLHRSLKFRSRRQDGNFESIITVISVMNNAFVLSYFVMLIKEIQESAPPDCDWGRNSKFIWQYLCLNK